MSLTNRERVQQLSPLLELVVKDCGWTGGAGGKVVLEVLRLGLMSF